MRTVDHRLLRCRAALAVLNGLWGDYLARTDIDRYRSLIARLGIRR